MSDISSDQATPETSAPNLSDIANNAFQMSGNTPPQVPAPTPYNPPAWLQPDQSIEAADANLSDISHSQSATQRITVRLSTTDLTILDARAHAVNASRSDLLRTLIALPVTLDLTSIRRATPGTETITRPLGPDLALMGEDGLTTIQAITDGMLESISNEVRAIGVNYNQSVRALNRFLKKYGNHRALSQEERHEITELYERLSKQNKAIYERLKALAAEVEALSENPSANLTAVGMSRFGAPINKDEPERRHRVRGRKHGSNRSDQAGEGVAS